MAESSKTVDLVINGGTVYTPSGFVRASVSVAEGKIVALTIDSKAPAADKMINAEGKYVIPGLVDTHTHLRDPGFTHKEDYITGGRAAAAGGVTLTVDMPNVNPPPNTAEQFKKHIENAQQKAIVDFGHNAAGTVLEEIPKIAQLGPVGYKIFMMSDVGRDYPHMPGIGVSDHGLLLELFEAIAKTRNVAIVHPWDQQIWEKISQKRISSGRISFMDYADAVRDYDSIIFVSSIGTIINLQRVTDVKLHILHMSCKRAFEMVKQAKAEGQTITTEVNPHDVFLANNRENVERLGPYAIGWGVPKEEGDATWQYLVDGTADLVGTDHAPHTKEEKEVGWKDMWKAPGGTPALEWYLSLFLTEVNKERIAFDRVIQLCSENPAKIFSLFPRKGAIQVGSDADLVIVDMKKEKKLDENKVYTKCGWNPYRDMEVKGMPIQTFVRGTSVMEDGEVIGKPGFGKQVKPSFAP